MDDKKEIPKFYRIFFIIYYIFNFLMFLGVTLFIMFLFINPYLLKGKNVNKYSNDYCKNESYINHDLICTNTYFNYKKSKFIWISIDGLATDQLVDLHNFEKYGITTSFLNIGKYNKYTNMLYESMMTGKYNKNLLGKEMKYDNFINQLIEANYNISFIGWKIPIIALAGEDLSNKFYKKSIDNNHEILAFNSFCNMTDLFPFLNLDFINYQKTDPNNKIDKNLEKKIIELIDRVRDDDYYLLKKISKEIFFEGLDEIFSEVPNILLELNITDCLIKNFDWNNEDNISIIYYTTEVDFSNHNYGKNHIYSLLNSYIVEKMLINIMKWIDDDHPDYALIINSDHGGQHFYGEDTLRNHGEDFPGNEGIFYIYTNEFKNNYNKLKMHERYIDILDESVLLSEILINLNIPLESKGIPFQLINDEIFTYSSLKRKEIQLIKLIEAYFKLEKTEGLQKILKELNESFCKIENKSFNKTDINSRKRFKEINKNNLKRLIEQQNEINKLIDSYNESKVSVLIIIIIFIIILVKAFIVLTNFPKLLILHYFNSFPERQKCLLMSLFLFYFFSDAIFLFFSDNSKNLQFLVQLSVFINCILLLTIKINISKLNISNSNIENKIYYYFLMVFGFLFFQVFSEYSYSLNTIKSFFSRYKPQLLLNIFFLYPLLILFTIHEIKKYNFKNKNKKGEIVFKYIIMLNIIFIISIFTEDMSYKTYYYQNKFNLISMYISFIIYLIYVLSCFVINSLDLTNEDNRKLCISKNIELIFKSDLNVNHEKISDNANNKSNICIIQTNINELNKEKYKDKSNKDKKDNSSNYNYEHNNFIYLKLCIVQGIFWLSDETEKIYLFLSLIFFEFSNYVIEYLYFNFFNFSKDRKESEFPLKQNKNASLIAFIFYIIIQKIIIYMNHLFFLLIMHSYDINSCKQQQEKFIRISPNLALIVSYIVNFKFSFLTSAYYFEKNFLKKENNKKIIEFSIFFIVKRIIINQRMNCSVFLVILLSLMHIKEEQLWDFYAYYLEDFIFFLLDYLYVIIALIFYKILN